MAIMSFPSTSLAAGASSGNILAGKLFEFVNGAIMRAAFKTDDATQKLTMQILNGAEVIAQGEALPVGATVGIIAEPDDFHWEWIGRGRQQIVIVSANAAAKNYWGMVKVQQLR